MGKLGANIKFVRKALGLNQTDFADKLGFSGPTVISKYEKDQNVPDIATIEKIAAMGNKSIDWLVTGEEPDTSTSGALDVPPEHRDYTDKLVKILTSGNTSAITTVEKIIDMTLKEVEPPEKEGPGAASRAFTPDDEAVNGK